MTERVSRYRRRRLRRKLTSGLFLLVPLALLAAFKPVRWLFLVPEAARPETIEREYGDLLSRLDAYARRLEVDRLDELEEEIVADSVLQELCSATEILGAWITRTGGRKELYLQLHGVPSGCIGDSVLLRFRPKLGRSRTTFGWKDDYEFAYYASREREPDGDVTEIIVMFDYLQLEGLNGREWWDPENPGGPRDLKRPRGKR